MLIGCADNCVDRVSLSPSFVVVHGSQGSGREKGGFVDQSLEVDGHVDLFRKVTRRFALTG